MKLQDLTNRRFGHLTAIKYLGRSSWECKCDCGKIISIYGGNLKSGQSTSCGCRRINHVIHNKCHTRMYSICQGMKRRCTNPNCKDYQYYGGRGITICNEWRNNFQAFYDWAMSHGYSEELSIDRINHNGNYCPENCQWITVSENSKKSNIERKSSW